MRIGTFKGIPLNLHSTFFLIAGFYVISAFISGGISFALVSASLVFLLFGSVFLHEMGHALMARRYGIGTRSITLHLMGGFASIEREPRVPREEIAIALAGPAVNVCLFILAVPLVFAKIPLTFEFAAINFLMGIFNLIPAYPMDGGRVLRAILNKKYGYNRATAISLKGFTKAISFAMIILGIVYSWIGLILVGGFLLLIVHSQKK